MPNTQITWDVHFSQDTRDALHRLMLAMTRAAAGADTVAVATLGHGVDTTLKALALHFETVATAAGK